MEHVTHNIKQKTKKSTTLRCSMLHVPCFMKQNGFSILETIISITIFSLIILITITAVSTVFTGSKQGFLALDNVDNARSVSSRFTNEIRNAQIGVNGSYQIGTASDNQLIFYSKSAPSAATVNRINYYITGTILYKGITVPSGSPQIYNIANEIKTIVQRDVVNSGTPIFTYYDGNYSGSGSALTQPVNVNNIKYVKMTLVVLNQVKNQATTNFSISAGGTIRNLKNNLGN